MLTFDSYTDEQINSQSSLHWHVTTVAAVFPPEELVGPTALVFGSMEG